MQPLPPPPPYTPPTLKKTNPLDYQIVNSRCTSKARSREKAILPEPRRTNPIVWCGAVICLLFSLLLIFFGITTLIIFVAIKPKNPIFDVPQASLSVIYFDSSAFLNGDITFLANFTNPNKKLSVNFEYLNIKLYFLESLIATQVLQPFSQSPGEVRVIQVHLLSSLVYLPPNLALRLQKQEQRNRIVYNVKGIFRVRVKMGLIHYSYSVHGECRMEMTSPPNGVLISHNCRTKR